MSPPKPPEFTPNTLGWYKRRQGVQLRTALLVLLSFLLLQIAFWGGVIYIVLHFVFKWW